MNSTKFHAFESFQKDYVDSLFTKLLLLIIVKASDTDNTLNQYQAWSNTHGPSKNTTSPQPEETNSLFKPTAFNVGNKPTLTKSGIFQLLLIIPNPASLDNETPADITNIGKSWRGYTDPIRKCPTQTKANADCPINTLGNIRR